jgi:calcineurin-like phosphoesterase family protein
VRRDSSPVITDIDNTWLISDTHFGHANIERLCKRPPDTDTLMVEEWTRLVPADALLLHLGDVAYRADFPAWETIIAALPGNKHLILGNHDKQPTEYYERCGFKVVPSFTHMYDRSTLGMVVLTFDHYPRENAAMSHQLYIHGHIHNSGYGWGPDTTGSPARVGHVNLSVEVTKYRPVNLGTLLRAYFS